MFSLMAAFGVVAIIVFGSWRDGKEQKHDTRFHENAVRRSTIYSAEHIRLIAYYLAAILIMLGIIADRI
jgi:hypothetical protein